MSELRLRISGTGPAPHPPAAAGPPLPEEPRGRGLFSLYSCGPLRVDPAGEGGAQCRGGRRMCHHICEKLYLTPNRAAKPSYRNPERPAMFHPGALLSGACLGGTAGEQHGAGSAILEDVEGAAGGTRLLALDPGGSGLVAISGSPSSIESRPADTRKTWSRALRTRRCTLSAWDPFARQGER